MGTSRKPKDKDTNGSEHKDSPVHSVGEPVSGIFLEDYRIRLVGVEIDAESAALIMEYLLYLEKLDPHKEIEFFIDSPGGCVKSGFAIYDAMRALKNPIHTIGMGEQVSMASILFVAGDKRSMSPNSSIMMHQVSTSLEGKTSEIHIEMSVAEDMNERLKNIYVAHTGLNHEFWDMALEFDTWLTAEQALKIGFIDYIREPEKKAPYHADSERKRNKKSIFNAEFNAAVEYINKMSFKDICLTLNNAGSVQGSNAKHRSRMVTKLASFPQMWTAGKRDEMKKKAVSNDNKRASRSVSSVKTKQIPK